MKTLPKKIPINITKDYIDIQKNQLEIANKISEIIDYLTPTGERCGKEMLQGSLYSNSVNVSAYCSNTRPCPLHEEKVTLIDEGIHTEFIEKDWRMSKSEFYQKSYDEGYKDGKAQLQKSTNDAYAKGQENGKKQGKATLGDAILMATDGWVDEGRKDIKDKVKGMLNKLDKDCSYLMRNLINDLHNL